MTAMTQTDIPQEILSRLDALAAKLGTTVEQAWPMYVGFVQTEAIINGGLGLLFLVLWTLVLLFGLRQYDATVQDSETVLVTAGGLGIFIVIPCLFAITAYLPRAINPAGYVVGQVAGLCR